MSPRKTEAALRRACGTLEPFTTPQHCLYLLSTDSRRKAQPANHRPPDALQCGRSLLTGAKLRPRCIQPSWILGRKIREAILLTHRVPPSWYSMQSALGNRDRMCIQCVILKMGTEVTLAPNPPGNIPWFLDVSGAALQTADYCSLDSHTPPYQNTAAISAKLDHLNQTDRVNLCSPTSSLYETSPHFNWIYNLLFRPEITVTVETYLLCLQHK